ncbi:MAG: deoxynucleoside kinase [Arachidicoccus sp.]|nr:deoxynucleoside kinase [Arachidicoccus sp.]
MQYKFITIEGNIGAGKTTLANILAERLQARLILEAFSDNPFLPKFYENPAQFAFPLELFFMAERFKQLKEILQPDMFRTTTVSDYLFTKCLLFARVNLSDEEFKLYQRLFDIILQQLVLPEILIYLHAPVEKLQENIKKRQRNYEQQISDDYLQSIQETYLNYIQQQNLPTLFIDASNANFLEDKRHVQVVLDALNNIYGKGIHRISLP